MQLVQDIYAARKAAGRPVISFEVFPPKTDEGEQALFERTLPRLMKAAPDYCSVTYGAGGSTREKTLRIVERIQRECHLTTVAHLTCVGATREQIGELLTRIRALGVRNVLALRGDPPAGGAFQPVPGGFEYAAQLVRFIRQHSSDLCVGVAGFPEGHLACRAGRQADWNHLRDKLAEGASFVLTQLFFDNQDYFAFRDHLQQAGVRTPLVPGIIPILSSSQIKRFTSLCGARIPEALALRLEQLSEDDAAAAEFGIEYATRQCQELLRAGAPGIHFYALNKSASMLRVLQNLGLASA